MASRDLAGLLTGINGAQRPNPNMGSDEWRMAFGAQTAQNLGNSIGNIGGMLNGGKRSLNPQEAIQIGASKLDQKDPESLRILARLQNSRGDSAGAARTLARADAIEKQIADKEKEVKTRDTLSKSLIAEGAAEQAALVLSSDMTIGQAQQLLITLKGEERRGVAAEGRIATAKTASELKASEEDTKKKTITINNQKLVLESLDLKDSPLWGRVVSGDTNNLLASDFNTLVKTEKERKDNPVKIAGELTKYVVNGEKVWAAKTQIGDETPKMMYESVDADNKIIHLPLPADAEKAKDKTTKKGITFTESDVNSAVNSLQFAGKGSKEGIENNETWDSLGDDVKRELSIDVAQRTQDLVAEGTKESKALEQAIEEIYTNNLKAVEGSFYGWNDAEYIAPTEEPEETKGSTYVTPANAAKYLPKKI